MRRVGLVTLAVLLAGCTPQAVPGWSFSWLDAEWTAASEGRATRLPVDDPLPWPEGHDAEGASWTMLEWDGPAHGILYRGSWYLQVQGPTSQEEATRAARGMLSPLLSNDTLEGVLASGMAIAVGCDRRPCKAQDGGWLFQDPNVTTLPGAWLPNGSLAAPPLPMDPWDQFAQNALWRVAEGPVIHLEMPRFATSFDLPGVEHARLEFNSLGAATFTAIGDDVSQADARRAMEEALVDWPPLPDEFVILRVHQR